jgi:hypothetical protein
VINEEDGLGPEALKLRDKAITLRGANVRTRRGLEQYGVSFELTAAKVEFMFRKLFDMGLITDDQLWQMHVDWELELQEQLDNAKHQIESQLRQQATAQGMPDPTKNRPSESGLIVPGG